MKGSVWRLRSSALARFGVRSNYRQFVKNDIEARQRLSDLTQQFERNRGAAQRTRWELLATPQRDLGRKLMFCMNDAVDSTEWNRTAHVPGHGFA